MDTPRDPGVPALPPTQHELPYDDGKPMENDRHHEQMHLLTDTLKLWLGEREDWYVAGNRAVYFSVEQARNQDFRAPDVIVVTGLTDGRKERLSWVSWEEGGRLPDVVIEIVSPSTEREDRGRKRDVYAAQCLGEYFLFEPFSARLEGLELDAGSRRYVAKTADARGDLHVRSLGLALGLRGLGCYGLPSPSLRWIAGDGTPLLTGQELLEAADRRARSADQRAREAEAEAAALREELDRLRRG